MPVQNKAVKLLLTASGTVICILLTMKFHRTIIQKLKSLKSLWPSNLFFSRRPATAINLSTINDEMTCKEIIEAIKIDCNVFPVVGFDCEWVTDGGKRNKIALIQLCSSRGLCALIRVCKFPNNIPTELRNFLEDPEVLKVGVTPLTDAKFLFQDYGIETKSTFDLRFLGLLTEPNYSGGLAKMSKAVLDVELDKDWRLVCSNWESEILTTRQTNYAAYDAHVAVEIFSKLYKSIQPTIDDPKDIKNYCESFLDRGYKNKSSLTFINKEINVEQKTLLLKVNEPSKNLKRSYATRSSPLYDNCYLEAPDGELLCTVDRRKAEWYVKNNLGDEIQSESGYIVRLNFEPSGRAKGSVGDYYRSIKENKCVVCGRTQDLLRKNVVPHDYRKFFPLVMKSKTSHDIVLLCLRCHQQSNMKDLSMRKKLEAECNAPLTESVPRDRLEASIALKKEQRMARALLKENNIPEWRKDDMKQILSKSYDNQEITDAFLEDLLSKETVVSKDPSSTHANIVVESFKNKDSQGLIDLERLWREHFLLSMEPKFLPDLWDVNHNGNRLEIRASEGRVTSEELKIAGVNAVVMPKQEKMTAVQFHTAESNNHDLSNVDSSSNTSEWEFASAVGSLSSSNAGVDLDQTLTEDDRYFSDVTSIQSFYETVRSDGSTTDDFQSFASSFTERPDFGSDLSQQSSLSEDSDTEIEDNIENLSKNGKK